MKLIFSLSSPYARKVRVTLAEKDVAFEPVVVEAYDGEVLMAANPAGRVPALMLDDGSALADSPVICAWLDAHHPQPRLIPEGEAQWPVRQLESLADAVTDNLVKLRLEQLRAEAKRSPDLVARTVRKTRSALDALEKAPFAEALDLGQIALICALDYMDLRAPEIDWREGRPRLQALHGRLSERPSFAGTRPS